MSGKGPFTVAKTLIVNDSGEVLALRRSADDPRRPNQWDFPGGWVDADEEPAQAALREIAEESGLQLDRVELIFGLSEATEHGSTTWLTYRGHIVGEPKIILSSEHSEYRWVKPEVLRQEISYHRQQKMLDYALANHLL